MILGMFLMMFETGEETKEHGEDCSWKMNIKLMSPVWSRKY